MVPTNIVKAFPPKHITYIIPHTHMSCIKFAHNERMQPLTSVQKNRTCLHNTTVKKYPYNRMKFMKSFQLITFWPIWIHAWAISDLLLFDGFRSWFKQSKEFVLRDICVTWRVIFHIYCFNFLHQKFHIQKLCFLQRRGCPFLTADTRQCLPQSHTADEYLLNVSQSTSGFIPLLPWNGHISTGNEVSMKTLWERIEMGKKHSYETHIYTLVHM